MRFKFLGGFVGTLEMFNPLENLWSLLMMFRNVYISLDLSVRDVGYEQKWFISYCMFMKILSTYKFLLLQYRIKICYFSNLSLEFLTQFNIIIRETRTNYVNFFWESTDILRFENEMELEFGKWTKIRQRSNIMQILSKLYIIFYILLKSHSKHDWYGINYW